VAIARTVTYWITSLCAGGLVAGIGHFSTYSSSHGKFFDAFWLYAMPVPMGLGIFHLPAIFAGTILCGLFSMRFGKRLAGLLGVLFLLALIAHLALQFERGNGYWEYFAFGTVDLGILAIIGLLVAD
jgi:hypothetical protein